MLRHKGSGLYHTGWHSWSATQELATDFGNVDIATQRAKEEGLASVEVVIRHDGNVAEEVVQLRAESGFNRG